MKRVLLAVGFALGAIASSACAADLPTSLELRLQTIESRLPEPGRIDKLARKVRRLAQNQGVEFSSGASATGASGNVLYDLYQTVQRLEQKLRSLRGEIQELKHKFKQRKKRQRALYMNLSKRLKVIERKLGIRPGGKSDSQASAGGGQSGRGPGTATRKSAAEAYDAAFDLLSAGKFDKASARFEQFVHTYPHSEYTDNAWYWLGNARYINRKYDAALEAFHRVLNDFPGSRKVPGALYKIGVIKDERGKFEQARKILNRVIEQYPESNAADRARQRLDAMNDE